MYSQIPVLAEAKKSNYHNTQQSVILPHLDTLCRRYQKLRVQQLYRNNQTFLKIMQKIVLQRESNQHRSHAGYLPTAPQRTSLC